MTFFTQIGPITVEILGNDSVSELIKEELDVSELDTQPDPDLVLSINPKEIFESYKPSHFSGKDAMNFNKSEYYVGYLEYLNYIVQNSFDDKKISLHIKLKEQSKTNLAKKKLISLKKVEYSDINRLIKSFILSYAVFWNVFQLSLLKKNCSFIHGSIFQIGENGFLLTGTGGSGKTSIALQYLKKEKTKYLSEDYGIIQTDGTAYYNPKSISLYRTDIERENLLTSKAIEHLSPALQTKWKILTSISSQNQLLKVSPSNLLGNDKIGTSCLLKNVIYLVREDCNLISFEQITADEFSERATHASMVELKSLSEVLRRIKANSPTTYPYKSDNEIFQSMKDIYQNAFSKSNCYLIHVPKKEKAENIARFLTDHNLIEI